LDHGGKILFLGTGIGVMTFFHAVEELLEPTMPFSAFTVETFTLTSRSYDGSLLETTTRLFEPAHSRRRNLARVVPTLRANGAWQAGRLGGLDVILLNASDILHACRELGDKGVYCYDD
jgi:aminoglycoside N3'-acetyltransferase